MDNSLLKFFEFDVFVSYYPSQLKDAKDLERTLTNDFLLRVKVDDTKHNYRADKINDILFDKSLVEKSQIIVCFTTKKYFQNDFCVYELKFAIQKRKQIFILLFENFELNKMLREYMSEADILSLTVVIDFTANARLVNVWTGKQFNDFISCLKSGLSDMNPFDAPSDTTLLQHYEDLQPFINRSNIWLSNLLASSTENVILSIRTLFRRINHMLLDLNYNIPKEDLQHLRNLNEFYNKFDSLLLNRDTLKPAEVLMKYLIQYNKYISSRLDYLSPLYNRNKK